VHLNVFCKVLKLDKNTIKICYNRNMEKLTFNKFINRRKTFLNQNQFNDHTIMSGTNNILISAPHGVPQVRLGKHKFQEPGSLSTALHIYDKTNSFIIAKTKCNNDDANFDEASEYKNNIKKLIKEHKIKYVLDFHGLASHRDCDINLGVHLGKNIKTNVELFNKLHYNLIKAGFKVSIDQPFMAGARTISGTTANEFEDVWSLQIEINCNITNRKENFDLNKKMLKIFIDWINKINNN
jgi:hypothetical protein